nr:hypothetical protein [Tanacetum cinerariifolium]
MSPFIIPVSDDSTNESIGSFAFLIILSDTDYEAAIPTTLPIALKAKATVVVLPARVRDMVIHPALEFDTYKDLLSFDHAPVAPIISPTSHEDHYELDFDSESSEDSSKDDAPEPYKATIACWRTDVLSHSSSSLSTAPTPSTPLQIVLAVPVLPRRPAILVLPRQKILFGRPYRTHHNEARMMLTARKRVRPLPALLSTAEAANTREILTLPSPPTSVGPSRPLAASLEVDSYEMIIEESDETSSEASVRTSVEASIEDITEVAAEPIGPFLFPKSTVGERLDEQGKAIRDMYEHLLEMPIHWLEEIENE